MTLKSLITGTNISLATSIHTAHSQSTETPYALSNFYRGGSLVADYDRSSSIAEYSFNSFPEIRFSQFANTQQSPWQIRSLRSVFFEQGVTEFVLFKDNDQNLEGTQNFYTLSQTNVANNPVTEPPVVIRLNYGDIEGFYFAGSQLTYLPNVWLANSCGRIVSAVYNNNTNKSAVLGINGELGFSNDVPWADGWAVSTIGAAGTLGTLGDYIIRVNGLALSNSVTVRYTIDGQSWSQYSLSTAQPLINAKLTISGGWAFIHGGNGMCYVSASPWQQFSWVRLQAYDPYFASSGSTVQTVCVGKNGVFIAASSTTLVYASGVLNNPSFSTTLSTLTPVPMNSIRRIVPFYTGFLAFGVESDIIPENYHLGNIAWSPNGQTWYHGIGSRSLVKPQTINDMQNTTKVNEYFYDSILDRHYLFTNTGLYGRTDGYDLRLFDGTNYLPSTIYAGYFSGGSTSFAIGISGAVRILRFSDDTLSNTGYLLASPRSYHAGVNSSTRGYFGGGIVNTNFNSSTNNIESYNFISGNAFGINGSLSVQRYGVAGINSKTNGYFGGGIQAGVGNIGVIDVLTFSNETAFPAQTALSASRGLLAGASGSGDYGYFAGGTNISTRIDAYLYSTNSINAANNSLSFGRQSLAGVNSVYEAFFAGGVESSITFNQIEKVTFSLAAAVSTVSVTLSSQVESLAGVNSGAHGYFAGGVTNNYGLLLSRVEKFDMINSTISVNSSSLPTNIKDFDGVQSGGIL